MAYVHQILQLEFSYSPNACSCTTAVPEGEKGPRPKHDDDIPNLTVLGHPAPLMQSSAVSSVGAHHMDCLDR
jgi:hypothetical protein